MRIALIAGLGLSLACCAEDPAIYPVIPYSAGSGPAYGTGGYAAPVGDAGGPAFGDERTPYTGGGYGEAAPFYAPPYVAGPVVVPGATFRFGFNHERFDRNRWERERLERERAHFEQDRARPPSGRNVRADERGYRNQSSPGRPQQDRDDDRGHPHREHP